MSPKEYANILHDILKIKSEKHHAQILKKFKFLLVKNKDAHLANAIEKEFQKIQEQKEQEKTTCISSASKLTTEQKKKIESISAEPREFSVNPKLLGGIAVRQKDRVYNATLRKKIESLKWQL